MNATEPITCDVVRRLVESAGKAWAVVISSDGEQTQFTTWGRSAGDKVYASNLSEYIAEDLCPAQPTTVLESFHGKEEAARNKEELERLRDVLLGIANLTQSQTAARMASEALAKDK